MCSWQDFLMFDDTSEHHISKYQQYTCVHGKTHWSLFTRMNHSYEVSTIHIHALQDSLMLVTHSCHHHRNESVQTPCMYVQTHMKKHVCTKWYILHITKHTDTCHLLTSWSSNSLSWRFLSSSLLSLTTKRGGGGLFFFLAHKHCWAFFWR